MSKRVAAIVVAIGLLWGGAYYGSPYWAVHQMQAAARAGEGDRLAGYIDFPAVRESIKSQLQAKLMKQMQNDNVKPIRRINTMPATGWAAKESPARAGLDAIGYPAACEG
jgi:hypothetical protein